MAADPMAKRSPVHNHYFVNATLRSGSTTTTG